MQRRWLTNKRAKLWPPFDHHRLKSSCAGFQRRSGICWTAKWRAIVNWLKLQGKSLDPALPHGERYGGSGRNHCWELPDNWEKKVSDFYSSWTNERILFWKWLRYHASYSLASQTTSTFLPMRKWSGSLDYIQASTGVSVAMKSKCSKRLRNISPHGSSKPRHYKPHPFRDTVPYNVLYLCL